MIGDFGTGTTEQSAVASRMCSWRAAHPFDLVVTTGDNVYPDGRRSRFDEVFYQPYACLLGDGVRFRASLGNHDVVTRNGRPEIEEKAFGMPSRNYVLRNSGVRLVVLNSNRLRLRWLERALGHRRPGDRWTVAVLHHPVYSPGTGHGSTPGFRRLLNDSFRRHGVDLVLSGHDHVYAVTRAIRRIRYVVTGGGGRGLYGCRRAWFSVRCRARHHLLYIRAGRDRIRVSAVPAFGEPFHRWGTRGRP